MKDPKLQQWLHSLSIENTTDVEITSGRVLGKVLQKLTPESRIELSSIDTALHRVNNWNILMYGVLHLDKNWKRLALLSLMNRKKA